jgi:stage III sporulation protein AE
MKRFLVILTVLLLIPVSVYGDDVDYNEYINSYDLSFLEESADKDTYKLLEELGVADFNYESLRNISFEKLAEIIGSTVKKRIKRPASGALAVIIYILLSSFFQSFKSGSGDMEELFSTVSALVIAVVLIVYISPSVSFAGECIGIASDFIYAFIPAFCAIIAASGGISSSFTTNTMLLALSQGMSILASQIFLPVVNCFLSVGICSGLRAELNLSRLVAGMKKLITSAISLIAGGFVSVLSIKTTISTRADYLGIRSLRFVITSVVPVIGGSLSEGLLSIQSYSSLLKSSVGIVGILAVALMFLPSLVELLLWRVTLGGCLIICDVFEDKSVSSVLSAFRDTVLLVTVLCIVCVLTTVVSIGILIAERTN